MATNIFGKGFYGLGGGGVETPFEAAMQGAQGVQNIFARQMELDNARQEQQARNALRGQMGGMDMQNPDYAKIFSLAPAFGLKFMEGMTQLNEQQRLAAQNNFKTGQDIIERALPLYAANPSPEIRTNIATALKAQKYSDDYINAILPDPNQYPDRNSFQNAMLASFNVNEYIKGVNKRIELGITQTTEKQKTAGRLKQEGMKQETAMMEIAGRQNVANTNARATLGAAGIKYDLTKLQQGHVQTVQLSENQWANLSQNPENGEIRIKPWPEGVRPQEKQGKGTGKPVDPLREQIKGAFAPYIQQPTGGINLKTPEGIEAAYQDAIKKGKDPVKAKELRDNLLQGLGK